MSIQIGEEEARDEQERTVETKKLIHVSESVEGSESGCYDLPRLETLCEGERFHGELWDVL